MPSKKRNLTQCSRLALGAAFLGLAVAGCGGGPASDGSNTGQGATSFKPKGQVTMIVPFDAGGGSDLLARTMASGMSSVREGLKVSVENRPGGNGVVGYNFLKQHKGNPQFLLGSETAAVALPILLDPAPFHWTDFTPIAQIAQDAQILVVSTKSKFQALPDLLAEAKQSKLKVGLTSTTSSDAIVTKLLEKDQGVKFQPVVLESGSNSVARLLNGDIDFTVLNPSETIGQMKAGNLRPLAAFAEKRFASTSELKDVPTAAEQGVEVNFAQYRGLFAPGDLSEAEIQYWTAALLEWTKTSSYNEYITKNNLFAVFRSGDEFKAYLTQTEETLKDVLGDAK